MSEESFGALLRYYRRRARDSADGGSLSQDRLADLLSQESGIVYSRGAVSDWERGKGHIHKDARHLLVSLLRVLVAAGGVRSREEADALLAAGNYRALNADEAAQVAAVAVDSAEWRTDPATATDDSAVFMAPALPPHAIIGRDDVLGTLREQLSAGHNVALSAINGLPGVGKTTLAALLAHDAGVREQFPDGVLWVGLGRDPDLFHQLGVWAQAVGVDSAELERLGALKLRANAVHAAIRDRRMLLIIDDVWDDAPVRLFTVGGSACAHVLTTRQPRIAAGFAGNHALKVAELSDAYAFELLRQLAPRVVAQEPEAARDVVRACGGLPLALVLVGNYLRIQAATGQGRRIRSALAQMQSAEKRLHVQRTQSILDTQGHPSLPDDAPISLATIIDVSDQELSDAARAALRALALFPPKPNSFSEEAALFVAGTTTDVLDELSDHGLLETVGRERYALHQAIAEYAQLESVDVDAEVSFIHYYTKYVQQHADNYLALGGEFDNVTVALYMAQQIERDDLLWALLDAVFQFLELKGYYDLAEQYLKHLLEGGAHTERDQARMWLHLGRLPYKCDDFSLAIERWENGLALAYASDAHETAVALLSGLSMILSDRAQYEKAIQYSQKAAEHALASNNWYELCRSHAVLGRLALIMDRLDEADSQLEVAFEIAQQRNLPSLACVSLNMRGIIAKNRGQLLLASELYYEGLKIARAHRLEARTLEQLVNLGELHNELHDYVKSTTYLEEGIKLARKFGDRSKEAHLLLDLATASVGIGNIEKADQQLSEALGLAKLIRDSRLAAHIHVQWGTACLENSRYIEAEEHFKACLEILPNVSRNKRIAGLTYLGLAKIEFAKGNSDSAKDQARKGLRSTERTGQSVHMVIQNWMRENGFDPGEPSQHEDLSRV